MVYKDKVFAGKHMPTVLLQVNTDSKLQSKHSTKLELLYVITAK